MSPTAQPLQFTAASWPTPTQQLLLRACLASGPTAIEAWRAWQAQVVFDELDHASLRLVPLLSYNLSQLGVDDPALGRYRGIQRKSWYENQLLFRQATQAVEYLQARGISTLLLKGVPLAQLYYPAVALRPMSDFDLLVPYAQAPQAIAALPSAGWFGERHRGLADPTPHRYPAGHAWSFRNEAGANLDLHWRILKTSFAPDPDADLWEGAEKFSFGQTLTLTLNPTDHLFHICAHGLPMNQISPMRWIVDATMIMRRREIDWARFLARTQTQRTTLIMRHALTYLRNFCDAPVPGHVFTQLEAMPIEHWESAEFSYMTRRHGNMARRLQVYVYDFCRFRRTTSAMAAGSPVGAYLHYWKIRWDLPRRRDIPSDALRRFRQFLAEARTRRLRRPTTA